MDIIYGSFDRLQFFGLVVPQFVIKVVIQYKLLFCYCVEVFTKVAGQARLNMLSTYELKSRTSKFEREAKERAIKEQQRQAREQRRKERLQAKLEEYEEQQRIQRIADRQAQEQSLNEMQKLPVIVEFGAQHSYRCSRQMNKQQNLVGQSADLINLYCRPLWRWNS
eukprot:TRINITY_DN1995_c0_g1_i7.p1 TRINITY_DN1995_c0_g1~~TRINITY_DN1995_c0_g1_i7.p1  ORF type:complete len:166 (-),score=7.20 TRINITY_DN1995_c0_g1_i7:6-503(-)